MKTVCSRLLDYQRYACIHTYVNHQTLQSYVPHCIVLFCFDFGLNVASTAKLYSDFPDLHVCDGERPRSWVSGWMGWDGDGDGMEWDLGWDGMSWAGIGR